MIYKKIMYLLAAIAIGGLLTTLKVPAGWLIGALLTGIFYRFVIGELMFNNWVFKIALAIVGANVGLMMDMSFFSTLYLFLFPLFVSITLTILCGLGLAKLLYKYSRLSATTCFFCCIPGGASEAIGISQEYGADQNIVAAFHSTRIIIFVLTIPFLVGSLMHVDISKGATLNISNISISGFITVIVVVLFATVLTKLFKIPLGTLIFSMSLGFILNQFVPFIESPPAITAGLGQALIGGIIGLRFNKETLIQLKKVGWMSIVTMLLLFLISLGISFVFFELSSLDYLSSLLATVPAGAGEMASTALFLNMDASLIAALQTARLLTVFLMMPYLIRFVLHKDKNNDLA